MHFDPTLFSAYIQQKKPKKGVDSKNIGSSVVSNETSRYGHDPNRYEPEESTIHQVQDPTQFEPEPEEPDPTPKVNTSGV